MRYFLSILSVALALCLLIGCQTTPAPSQESQLPAEEETQIPAGDGIPKWNGEALSDFSIVYDADAMDYNLRAAEYIQSQIQSLTKLTLPLTEDNEPIGDHELVVGETNRPISKSLSADTEGSQFAILAKNGSIALEGEAFVIAAAAYFFVETYVPSDSFEASIPQTVKIHDPIVLPAKNHIILIGDGMGVYQTLLHDTVKATVDFSDGEDLFYGYLLPHRGYARTVSLSGVTDSAASGTALATGFKTTNRRVGMTAKEKDLTSLTELAGTLGKATAVMSTEPSTGATPAAFSAHATDRELSSSILSSQEELVAQYGTLIRCDYNVYTKAGVEKIEETIRQTLTELSTDEDGFFLMYEEAHIDKYCHNKDITNAFRALSRFNQAIGIFMEYAFYHPDTFVLITADHETGNLLPNASGGLSYGSGDHSAQHVPVFAFGDESVLFDGITVENTQIPKTIAAFWSESFGDDTDSLPALQLK